MASNDVKIVIKATDEASPTFNTIKSGLGGVSDAMRKVQTDTNSLSGYIKEQRKEGREHKFIIGEMKDGLAAAGLMMNLMGSATGGATGQMKTLTDSVNKGIVVFYGMDAVVSILGKSFKVLAGPIGLAITAVIAIGGAIASYISESERIKGSNKTTEESFKDLTTEVDNLLAKLKGTSDANKVFLETNINIVEIELVKLKEKNKALEEQTKTINSTNLAGQILYNLLFKNTTELDNNSKKIKETEDRLTVLRSAFAGLGATVTAQGIPPIKDLTKEAEKAEMQFWKTTRSINKLMSELKPKQSDKIEIFPVSEMRKNQQEIDEIVGNQKIEWDSLAENQKENFALMSSVAFAFRDSLNAAFSGELSGIKDFFKNILGVIIDALELKLIALGIDAAISAGLGNLTGAFKAFGTLATQLVALEGLRAGVNSMHTGGTAFVNAPANREVPIMVRGQETIRVNTPEQERRSSGGGIVINFNSPVSDVAFTRNSILKVLKETGLSIESAFINQSNKVSIA